MQLFYIFYYFAVRNMHITNVNVHVSYGGYAVLRL